MADQPADDTDDIVIAYVRGRLPAEEARRLEVEAAGRPELAAEIAVMRGIVETFDAEARAPAPGELGWARLSRAIGAEPPRAAAPATPSRRPLWPLAASAAAAVLVWQLAAVPLLTRPGEEAGYAPVSETPAGFTLDVAFAPAASEGAIRELIRSVDGRVSDGPSAIGLWQLSFPNAEARDIALQSLAASPIVESVQ
jgi:anti-sigma-K factor RskA